MSPRKAKVCLIARICFAAGCLALTGLALRSMVNAFWIFSTVNGGADDWLILSIVNFFAIAASMLSIYLGWRVVARWDTGTVRRSVGFAVMLAMIGICYLINSADPRQEAAALRVVVLVMLMTPGAIAYRLLSRTIIRWAELEDSLDADHQPEGHFKRVQFFGAALAIAVAVAVLCVAPLLPAKFRFAGGAIWILGLAVGTAIMTYKSVAWLMLPKQYKVLPPGGFEVLPRDDSKL